MKDIIEYEHLCFSGGGLGGMLFHGARKAVQSFIEVHHGTGEYEEWFSRLKGIAGTSAGSVYALIFLLQMSDVASLELVKELCKRSSYMRRPDIGLLTSHFGLDEAGGLHEVVAKILESSGLAYNVTFAELFRFFRKRFVIVACCLETSERLYLSHETFPNMQVRDAIVGSCSIPFVYAPLKVGDNLTVVDGALAENSPLCFANDSTLNFRLRSPLETSCHPHRSFVDYVSSLISVVTFSQKQFPKEHTLLCYAANPLAAFSFDDSSEDDALENIRFAERLVTDQLEGNPRIRLLGTVVVCIALTHPFTKKDETDGVAGCGPDRT